MFIALQKAEIIKIRVERISLDSSSIKVHPDAHGSAKKYEDDKTRELAILLGYTPVTPPKSNRLEPWEYDEEEYKHRNEVERFFRRYKEYRRICTRYDKLDIMFLFYFTFALIFEFIR